MFIRVEGLLSGIEIEKAVGPDGKHGRRVY